LYLALDEIYHPFWAAISNNPTRQEVDTEPGKRKSKTGFSPSMIPCSKRFIPAPPEIEIPIDYNSPRFNSGDFRLELFPLHSPLLGESLLVSFPPLSYMLKFSGWSCLISGQDLRGARTHTDLRRGARAIPAFVAGHRRLREKARGHAHGTGVQGCSQRSEGGEPTYYHAAASSKALAHTTRSASRLCTWSDTEPKHL
jgi:hypothetical protein